VESFTTAAVASGTRSVGLGAVRGANAGGVDKVLGAPGMPCNGPRYFPAAISASLPGLLSARSRVS